MHMPTQRRFVMYLIILLSAIFFTACSKSDCPDCIHESTPALNPEEDMVAYLSLSRHTLYVLPKHEKIALDALSAHPIGFNLYKAPITAASGEPINVIFTMNTIKNPSLFADMDGTFIADIHDIFNAVKDIVKDATQAAKDTANDAANNAVDEAAETANNAIDAAESAANAAIDAANDAADGG